MRGTQLTGSGIVVGAHLRSGWRGLLAWGSAMSALVLAVAWSISELYPTLADRRGYAESAGASAAVAAFNGRGHDLTQTGGIVGYEVGFMALVGFPILAIHLAVRFSRHEEDAGRTELVTAGRVGRLAPMAGAAATVGACLAGFVVVTGLGLQAIGLPVAGSWRYAVSLGLFAAAFAAIGLLAAEVSREGRTAYALGLSFVMVTFLLRAVVDGRGWDATWASPSGWLAEARPWGASWQWWPYAAYAASSVLCVLLALATAAHRDLNGGLVAARSGPAYGTAALGTPVGLAWRFTRAPLLGWLLGTATWNAAFGGLAGEMADIVESNPTLLDAMGLERPEHLVTTLALLLCGVGAAAFGVQAVGRLAHEESRGRLGLVLATRVPRSRLWSAWLGVTLVGTAAVLLVSTLSLGLVAAWSTGDGSGLGDTVGGGLALVPPVALVVTLAAALHGLAPRLAALAWVAVGWVTVVGLLGETLRLPGWSRDLSPVHAVGRVPVEDPNAGALVVCAVLAAALLAGGLARFRTRQLVAG